MNPVYFETIFLINEPWNDRPKYFAIITAHATTGEKWTEEQNAAADQALEQDLRKQADWVRRITGYSPITGHAEPGWAVNLEFHAACDIGQRYKQDAIYFVEGNLLVVSFCDARRSRVPVGEFSSRVHLPAS